MTCRSTFCPGVFSLLGPNGAGKTTTVRMLIGVIRPDEGQVAISLDATTSASLPQSAPESMAGTVWQFRRLAGRIFEIGMLMYRKEPTLAEMWRWARQAGPGA